jgi:hypothetical protein
METEYFSAFSVIQLLPPGSVFFVFAFASAFVYLRPVVRQVPNKDPCFVRALAVLILGQYPCGAAWNGHVR